MAGCTGGAGSRMPLAGGWLARFDGPVEARITKRSHFKRQLKQNEVPAIQETNPIGAR
jgi:hypothetical protein